MKLYTEEQVKVLIDALNDVRNWDDTLEDEYEDAGVRADFGLNYFSHSTPIELPSDEEIEKDMEGQSGEYSCGWEDAFKWMKEQILNQNK